MARAALPVRIAARTARVATAFRATAAARAPLDGLERFAPHARQVSAFEPCVGVKPTCACLGHYGSSCTACPNCGSHGTCNDGLSGDGLCLCQLGWSGALCDHNVDDCASEPCDHGI